MNILNHNAPIIIGIDHGYGNIKTAKRCRVCGVPIAASCNAVKYCPRCARQERRRQDVERKRKRALGFRK